MPADAPLPRRGLLDAEVFRLWALTRDQAQRLSRVRVLRARGAAARDDGAGESHTVPTLLVCLAGVARIACAGRAIDLGPGEALVIAPGAWHRHEPLRTGSATYGQGFLAARSDVQLELPGRRWWLTVPLQPSLSLARRLLEADDAARVALARKLLAEFAGSAAEPLAPLHPAAQRMWDWLRRGRRRPIDAADVVRASGLRTTRAYAVFRSAFGETIKAALLRHKLELALSLLREGAAVTDVADACGFRGRADLTRAFRRTHGVSPRRWREVG